MDLNLISQDINNIKKQLISLSDRLTKLEKNSKATVTPKKMENKSCSWSVNDNKVYVSTKNGYHYVSGNTYNIRSLLKNMYAKWDGDEKCWKIKKDGISSNEIVNVIEDQGITVANENTNVKQNKSEKLKQSKSIKSSNDNVSSAKKAKNDKTSSNGKFAMLSDSDSD